MSMRRQCPNCKTGVGHARKAEVKAGKIGVIITLVCAACGHEWEVDYESPPSRPIDPDKH
jgi:hypothetical protein